MAFKNLRGLDQLPSPEELTARMVGIGMVFAAKANRDAEIESTLVHASVAGMEQDDLRVLAVLTTWFGVHHTQVNADRLIRLVRGHGSERVRVYWSALATWLAKDRRFARLAKAVRGSRVDLLPTGTEFQIKRRGEDDRFAATRLRVPAGTLRDRSADVLLPEALVRRHPGYRKRVDCSRTGRGPVGRGPVGRGRGATRIMLVRDGVAGCAGFSSSARG